MFKLILGFDFGSWLNFTVLLQNVQSHYGKKLMAFGKGSTQRSSRSTFCSRFGTDLHLFHNTIYILILKVINDNDICDNTPHEIQQNEPQPPHFIHIEI